MTEERPIVYIVDDDLGVRKSLDRLLRLAGYETKTFSSAIEFLDFDFPDQPGCVILDIEMPKLSGLELQSCLVEKGLALPIIFLTAHGTVPLTVKAFKSGAIEFIEKPSEKRDILNAVSLGIERGRQQREHYREITNLRRRFDTLSPRERSVFRLVVEGMLNKQIAFELQSTEKTIKAHRARVMQKMGAQSLADLVRFAEKLEIRSLVG